MVRIVFAFLSLICTATIYAQFPAYFSHNIENGAPSNEIYSVIQDKKGYLWIGCDAGVYRFNGVQYEYLLIFTFNYLKSDKK
jgi:ligand-binding sensor domain-containing protein